MEIEITEIERHWWYPEYEESKKALQFSWIGCNIYLVRDTTTENMWDLHFGDLRILSSEDRLKFIEYVINWLPTGSYLGTCGTSTRGGESGFRKIGYYLEDTGCLRVLHDKSDGHETYFPIYQKK